VLIGPPNSGKSTLFNRLTGLRQKVANFPGVTVEQRLGLMAGVGREDLTLIDLPGIYSLTPYSEDARVAVDVLRGKMPGTPKPDAVLLVLDSLHLTRQLMLAAPVGAWQRSQHAHLGGASQPQHRLPRPFVCRKHPQD
jgi:ferrous iron transport protein B